MKSKQSPKSKQTVTDLFDYSRYKQVKSKPAVKEQFVSPKKQTPLELPITKPPQKQVLTEGNNQIETDKQSTQVMKDDFDRVNRLLSEQIDLNQQLYTEFKMFARAVVKL